MPFQGNGLFTRIYQWVNDEVLGLNVDATRTDTDSNDIASGLSNCVTRDGQSPWFANLPAGGYKITGLGAGTSSGDSVNYGQTFIDPVFTNARSFNIVPVGDNSQAYATTAMVQQIAIQAATPAQPGGAGRYDLTSLAGIATWLLADAMDTRAITATSTVTVSDAGNLVDVTAGTFVLSFDPVATLGDKTSGFLRNTGTGFVTLDPNGAETIDGLSSYVMYPREVRRWYVDGTAIKTFVVTPFYISASVGFNMTWPPGYGGAEVDLLGASGGAGSGARGSAGVARPGGGAGGAPARVSNRIQGIAPGTVIVVTVGAAGASGAAITVDGTSGANGTAGGNTSFGAYSIAYGGVGGIGGSLVSGVTPVTSGSGGAGSGVASNGSSGGPGGKPQSASLGDPIAANSQDNIELGGGASHTNQLNDGGCAIWGGAGAGRASTTGTGFANNSGSSLYGVPGASHGGWITTANTMPTRTINAGARRSYLAGGGAVGGNCGTVPTSGQDGVDAMDDTEVGASGAGGGSSITVSAASGGRGGYPGGAPGGGGASTNGFNSGAGGAAAGGRAVIKGI